MEVVIAVKKVTVAKAVAAVKKLEVMQAVKHVQRFLMSYQVPDLLVPTSTHLKMSAPQLQPTC